MIRISGFRYKWFSGSVLWTDIMKSKNANYISLAKALVAHDPIDTTSKWILLRLSKNVFIITLEEDAMGWKDKIVEMFGEDVDFIPVVVRENEKAYAFCWRKDYLMYKPVDDLRSWSFNRADKNFFYLYPHVVRDDETREVLRKLKIISAN